MATIVILGAGVMASALVVPASDNEHKVTLVGSPLDEQIVARLKQGGGVHSKLDAPLAETVTILNDKELTSDDAAAADLLIVGVSSPGIPWAIRRLNELLPTPKPVAFVTKGLDRNGGRIVTYAETVAPRVQNIAAFIGIGGPCIARELANRFPTLSIYASQNRQAASAAAALMGTPYYRLAVSEDATGVEACAALKNFYAIGVSAMQTRYPDRKRADGQSKNPTAGVFNQAAQEMAALCEQLGGSRETAFDLAGLGDLHVTVGGGRNSRLGHGLGQNRTVSEIMGDELRGETVEGIDTARIVDMHLQQFDDADTRFPLAVAITKAIIGNAKFEFKFDQLFC